MCDACFLQKWVSSLHTGLFLAFFLESRSLRYSEYMGKILPLLENSVLGILTNVLHLKTTP